MKRVVLEAGKYYTSFITGIPEHLSSEVSKQLQLVESFDFNVFVHCKAPKGFTEREKYINFINEITQGYNRKIVYHNDLHETDVLQTTFILITKENIVTVFIHY